MSICRIIRVQHADPLGALRDFLAAWWAMGLQGLLAPIESADRSGVVAHPIDQPGDLERINPFAPIMPGNAAALVDTFVRQRPGQRLAVLLRPCELRTLIELRKRRRVPFVDEALAEHRLALVGVDCVATCSEAEYAQRVNEYGAESVMRDALMYAGEDAYSPYELRPACKICDWPAPRGAEVTIGILGVPVEQYLLVIAPDAEADARWRLGAVAAELASESQAAQREAAVCELIERRMAVRAQQLDWASGNLADLARVLSWLAPCTLCGDCLDACPLYNGELAGLLGVGSVRGNHHAPLPDFIGVARWLASCSGCGLCESACEQGVPLGLITAALSHGIRGGLQSYVAGAPDRPLPWVGRT